MKEKNQRSGVIALIPARSGSKGVPKKNIKPLGGRPLIQWSIDSALRSKLLDRVVVSTDCPEIAAVALQCGAEVPFRRPKRLASDVASGIDVVLHALKYFPTYKWLLLLQPTSPFRNEDDVDGIIEMCINSGRPAAVSLSLANETPYWMYTKRKGGSIRPILRERAIMSRRQDLPEVYKLNGALYFSEIECLIAKKTFVHNKTSSYIMPAERSIDIDTEDDWAFAEYRVKKFKL